ncbi:MAG: dihydrolipoyl dehydrogenase [Pseudomonadota bacterium]
MSREVDVAILGSGSAGLNALGQVRKAGKSHVMINGGEFGTTCARVGCMPAKALIQIAEDFHRRSIFSHHAISGGDALTLDRKAAMEHVRDLRDTFVDRVTSNSTDKMSKQLLIHGYARFLDPHTLEVNGKTIKAGKIIIATGSRPIVPDAWKDFADKVITTDELFELEDLPESTAVIGLGVIGLEIGQSLSRMGADVTGIELSDTISGIQDPTLQQVAIDVIGKEFPLWFGKPAELRAEDNKLRVTAGNHSVLVDKVIATLGRTPNLADLNLAGLGIDCDEHGIPRFNPNTMQVGDTHIFIAGDVNNHRPILHEAGDDGKIAGYNAVRDTVTAFRRKTPLAITFCDPGIASIGTSWNELDPEKTAIGEMKMAPVGRALIMAKNKGTLRVYADKATGVILGAAVMAPRAENLAHLICWAIEREQTVFDLLRMPFYHPVIEEALQAALYDLKGKVDAKPPAGLIELATL